MTSRADELSASMILGKAGYDSMSAAFRRAIEIIHDLEAENAKLNKGLAQALEQRNDARRSLCELQAMINEPEGFPAENKAWRERAKRRYAEEAWPGSADELWPEVETL